MEETKEERVEVKGVKRPPRAQRFLEGEGEEQQQREAKGRERRRRKEKEGRRAAPREREFKVLS